MGELGVEGGREVYMMVGSMGLQSRNIDKRSVN